MAGSVITTFTQPNGSRVVIYTMSWTADSADGSVPATAIPSFNGFVFLVTTNPGATAPTTLYDITLTDSDGIDIAQSLLSNRSATVSEQVVLDDRYVDGSLTLNITNNSVNSAIGTVKIYTYN